MCKLNPQCTTKRSCGRKSVHCNRLVRKQTQANASEHEPYQEHFSHLQWQPLQVEHTCDVIMCLDSYWDVNNVDYFIRTRGTGDKSGGFNPVIQKLYFTLVWVHVAISAAHQTAASQWRRLHMKWKTSLWIFLYINCKQTQMSPPSDIFSSVEQKQLSDG